MKMNKAMKKHIIESLKKGVRHDRRKLDEFRKVEVEYGISKSAEGSARVKVGNTEVLAGVKLGIDKPYPDTPDEGCLMVGAELLPLSSPEFEAGPPGIESIEIARVVDRGIRESGTIDMKITKYGLDALNIDQSGLDEMDNRILVTIIEKFQGGPVGLNTIATAVGEEAGTIEEVYEPFLIKEGYIKCPHTEKKCEWRLGTHFTDRKYLNGACYLSGSFELECPG